MTAHRSISVALSVIALALYALPASAQCRNIRPMTPEEQQRKEKYIAEYKRMVAEVQTLIDTHPEFPCWRVEDENLRIKYWAILRLEGREVSKEDTLIVTASLPADSTQRLLSIRMTGTSPDAVLYDRSIHTLLGPRLYRDLLSRSYAHTMICGAAELKQGDNRTLQ